MLAYYFYWYEPPTDEPRDIQEVPASLSLQFPLRQAPNWRSIHWHMDQLIDMEYAGIDVALAVYWGKELYSSTDWSIGGLEVMAAALDELDAQDVPHPKIGLFLDTYVLAGAHLTEPERQEWLLEQLSAFFRRIPARHLATQDGRPIIWLYYSDFANSFDAETFDWLSGALEEEFGARPFWVAERSWRYTTWTDGDGQRYFDLRRPMPFDAFYRWGGAFAGTLLVEEPLRLASLGPGYDDRSVVNRVSKFVRSRDHGCYYARNWRDAQAVEAQWAVVETWNEMYEGSAIAESVEYSRDYIAATARYTTDFKRGRPIALPQGCADLPPDEDTLFDRPKPLPDLPAPGGETAGRQEQVGTEDAGLSGASRSEESARSSCQGVREPGSRRGRPGRCDPDRE